MADVITAEIIREYLETVAEEISKTMESTAVSNVFNEAHDYSVGVFYYNGKEVSLVARALAVPVHIYACVVSAEAILKFFKDELYEGDVILVSDPYFGGSHIPDWTIMKPVFYNNKPVFFPSVRAHMLDVGGPVAGGYNIDARDIWQEGFRMAPLKIYEKGERRRDLWDLIKANNHIPYIVEGDVNAMIGACRVGERRIRELIDRYGFEQALDCVNYILDYSERRVRSAIASWPDGEYRGRSVLDQDFGGTPDVNVDVKIIVEGDECAVDFTGSHPQTPGFVNSTPGNTASYVYSAFTALLPEIPVNSGFFRPIKTRFPEGTVVNPLPPTPVGNSTVCIGADIGQATMKALEKIAPEGVSTAVLDLVILISLGIDRRYGQFFVSIDYHASPVSTGGAFGTDGWGGWAATFCALKLAPIEMNELQFPHLYFQAEYTTDSAAPGRWRGSPGYQMIRENTRDIEGEGWINLMVQSAKYPLEGYAGGSQGASSYVVLDYGAKGEKRVEDLAFLFPSPGGQKVLAFKGGGGGWGNPLDRDPALVLDDVMDEYVSIEGARRDYGVVINEKSMTIDLQATSDLRKALRNKQPDK